MRATRRSGRALPSCLPVFLLLALAGAPRAADGLERRFAYRVSWNGIPAARATVWVSDPLMATPDVARISASIETNAFVDMFWSLRAHGWGEADADTLRPQRFTFDRRINGQHELTEVEAQANDLLVGRYLRAHRSRLVEVRGAQVFDPVAAILHTLREPPGAGESETYDVFTGEARYRIDLRHDGTEVIRVPAGRFTAMRIKPVMWRIDKNAPETRARAVTLWITVSEPHTLLRVRGEVFIGAVYCDLTELSETAVHQPLAMQGVGP